MQVWTQVGKKSHSVGKVKRSEADWMLSQRWNTPIKYYKCLFLFVFEVPANGVKHGFHFGLGVHRWAFLFLHKFLQKTLHKTAEWVSFAASSLDEVDTLNSDYGRGAFVDVVTECTDKRGTPNAGLAHNTDEPFCKHSFENVIHVNIAAQEKLWR